MKQVTVGRRFSVGAYEVNVAGSIWHYTLDHKLKSKDKLDLWGMADREKHMLRLSDTLPNEPEARKTFIHEVTHIMLDAVAEEELADNEEFINKLGDMIYDTFERNGWLYLPTFLPVPEA